MLCVTLLCPLAVLTALAARADAAIAHGDLVYDLDSPPADPRLNSLDTYLPDGLQPNRILRAASPITCRFRVFLLRA